MFFNRLRVYFASYVTCLDTGISSKKCKPRYCNTDTARLNNVPDC